MNLVFWVSVVAFGVIFGEGLETSLSNANPKASKHFQSDPLASLSKAGDANWGKCKETFYRLCQEGKSIDDEPAYHRDCYQNGKKSMSTAISSVTTLSRSLKGTGLYYSLRVCGIGSINAEFGAQSYYNSSGRELPAQAFVFAMHKPHVLRLHNISQDNSSISIEFRPIENSKDFAVAFKFFAKYLNDPNDLMSPGSDSVKPCLQVIGNFSTVKHVSLTVEDICEKV